MGATVIGYWVGMSDEQAVTQPGFFNDDKAWADWMVEREQRAGVLDALDSLGLRALMSFTTDGIDDADVDWVAPAQLADAALRLRELVLEQDPRVAPIVEVYALSANGIDPAHEEFAQDLSDVAEIARFAERAGVTRMTLHVNW